MIEHFLAAYLFPHGERTIAEFFATGISLGGNTTWRLLRDDPTIRVAVPIIGLPVDAFAPYLGARAEAHGLAFTAPTLPPSLVPFLSIPEPEDAYSGKKILSIHGELDELVPYRFGKDKIAQIQKDAPEGYVEVFVESGFGHVCTPEMVRRTAEWFWRWGLSEPSQ
jgi:dienelactone hydrolase